MKDRKKTAPQVGGKLASNVHFQQSVGWEQNEARTGIASILGKETLAGVWSGQRRGEQDRVKEGLRRYSECARGRGAVGGDTNGIRSR